MTHPRLPAEWEPQSGIQLTWPHPDSDWREAYSSTLQVFVQIAGAIAASQPLLNVCRNPEHLGEIKQRLGDLQLPKEHLLFALADSNDSWARDHAPLTTLLDGEPVLNNFLFDGWGGKYPANKDNAISSSLQAQGCFGRATFTDRPWVLEGGAVETDGHGSLLATRSSLLDPRRNHRLTQADIEQRLRNQLGIQRFLWLDHGVLSGDDTDAHIDVLARFCDPHNLVVSQAPADDRDHQPLAKMYEQLSEFTAYDGQPLQLHPLAWPGLHHDAAGRRLPASYANFLITNQSVLLPIYGVSADQQAIQALEQRFPGRKVIGIDCRPLIAQNGSLHCLTMQFPQPLTLVQGHV